MSRLYRRFDGAAAPLRPRKESPMRALTEKILGDVAGVTAIEYGLIAGLVAVVIIGVLTTLGTDMSGMFSKIAASM
jgi:pilus assembly protein Flp/PilA